MDESTREALREDTAFRSARRRIATRHELHTRERTDDNEFTGECVCGWERNNNVSPRYIEQQHSLHLDSVTYNHIDGVIAAF